MEKRELFYTISGKVSWRSHYGKQYGGSLRKSKNEVAIRSRNPISGHIYRENSNSKRCRHPNVHSSTTYNNQAMEAP